MKIFKIKVENFRLLKNFSIDIEEDISLVIGKNNTGKTSLLSAIDKLLNHSDGKTITFDDFNVDFKNQLLVILEDPSSILEKDYIPLGIRVLVYISYDENDDLANVSKVMMDLDPDNNVVVLEFGYRLSYSEYSRLKQDFREFKNVEQQKKQVNKNYQEKSFADFFKRGQSKYFKQFRRSYQYDINTKEIDEKNYLDLAQELISTKEIINFKYIPAKRNVSNKDVDKTLSTQTSKIYKKTEATDEQNAEVERFKDELTIADRNLTEVYSSLFDKVVSKVRTFGGIKPNESEIQIISSLQDRELLEGNTTVVYKHDSYNNLPENYNGLGYMNLISMIFEIEILIQEFKKKKDEKPSDINLLFIEEPEAHTHPQMQYVFIKNIKELLGQGIIREDGINRNLQYIISTHSPHIVADSEFDKIKYLKKTPGSGIIAKNLKALQTEYEIDSNQYKFLKQYLTISRAEIFFADKAILIEGDTERILIPTIMRKIDIEEAKKYHQTAQKDPNLPLLSQNISIVEVGAYSQIFEKFIDFLGIKSMIVTDLDAINTEGKKCRVKEGSNYSNSALSFFFNSASLSTLLSYTINDKVLEKVSNAWVKSNTGSLCICFQSLDNDNVARSFEEAFIHINKQFIIDNLENMKGIKNDRHFSSSEKDSYDLADECVNKKTHFALDIIYNSNSDFSNWNIPSYINEGLLWLKQD
jgi:predicted ATP-dependent endonuclease of OLD family